MRTTIDIPDEIYRRLKVKAALEGQTVREIVLCGIQRELEPAEVQPPRKKFEIPVIPSTRKDKLVIDNETIYDLIDFP